MLKLISTIISGMIKTPEFPPDIRLSEFPDKVQAMLADLQVTHQQVLDENQKLRKQNEALGSQHGQLETQHIGLKSKHVDLESKHGQLKNHAHALQETVEALLRRIYGKRSERLPANSQQLLLFEDLEPFAEEEEVESIPAHSRQKPKRNGQDALRFSKDLPIEEVVFDLPESEKVCKETGVALKRIGQETIHKLAYEPARWKILQMIYPKYAHPFQEEYGVKTAPRPMSIIPRCRAHESLLAEIAVKKFADHLPLYRIHEIFFREGVYISKQQLSSWMLKLGEALEPLHKLMNQRVLDSKNLFIDETHIKMLEKGKGEAHTATMWVMVGGCSKDPPYRVYHFRKNRRHCHAEHLLEGYLGMMHSDKYGAYKQLSQKKGILWCPCWAHVRRKFFEAKNERPRDRISFASGS